MNNQTNKSQKEKAFDTVKYFRSIKEKIARETSEMTFKELKKYLGQRTLKTSEEAIT